MPSLNWIGKDEVINYNPPFHILNQKYTFNAENSDNMIIKGDNLLALKALLPRFEGKIKCIYIDPPYNTGNENWVYNDNVNSKEIKKWLGEVVGKDDLSRHDKWLCMMLPRLKLLHRLLSDDGVIFISIDDNEMANLKLLCDEVFGGGGAISNISILSNPRGRQSSKFIAQTHEYLLVYSKNSNFLNLKGEELTAEQEKEYALCDKRGRYRLLGLRLRGGRATAKESPTLHFPIFYNPQLNDFYLEKQQNDDIEIIPKFSNGVLGTWRWSKDKILKQKNDLIIKPVKDRYDVFQKDYLTQDKTRKSKSLWHEKEINYDNSAKELTNLGLEDAFNYAKPVYMINKIISMATDKNSIILDSFAGSGTTAHAVLELNKKDGGNRKFILVEMENYAENITAERVRRVIDGYGKEPKTTACGGDFSFYELGERLLLENGNINENVATNKIKEYIYFSETKQQYRENSSDFLGQYNGVAYYFIYKKDEITTLDFEYLANIKKASAYVIYADICVLSNDTMMKYSITFKKIPRDIKKV